MRQSVADSVYYFQRKLEGSMPWMYLDVLGYVTTAVGNKIDSIGEALNLPWKNEDGSPASSTEIAAAWQAVDAKRTLPKGEKQIGSLALAGGGAFQGVTQIRLSEDDIKALFVRTLQSFEGEIRNRFPDYDAWPADAQLAVLSMAWAMGPDFHYPKFQSAINQSPPDFVTAAAESHMQDANNPGLVPRNAANKLLLENAAEVLKRGLNAAALYWPQALAKSALFSGGILVLALAAGFFAWKKWG